MQIVHEPLGRCARYLPAEGAVYESMSGSGQLCCAHRVLSSLQVDVNGPVPFILLVSAASTSVLHLLYEFGITSGACRQ